MKNVAFASIVLAAGKGTRMNSRRAKVLHHVAGESLIGHVLESTARAGASQTIVVTSPGQDDVRAEVARLAPQALCVIQERQLGTADAVKAARPALQSDALPVIVLFGDTPLVSPETPAKAIAALGEESEIAIVGFEAADPSGYGRLIRDEDDHVSAIREDKDASDEEREIHLCNSGVMAFRSAAVLRLLDEIGCDNTKGEHYLTDIVEIARREGIACALVTCPEEEVMGVNSRADLAQAEALMQHRLRLEAMENGVTLISPETVYLSADTAIAEDVVIEPHVFIGPGVTIGANAVIRAFSHIEAAEIGAGASVGPYARLRPGARLGAGARIGNFVEVKNADIEDGAKVNHLTYIGDARVGRAANVGAGTITCNYDGMAKHFTDIGEGAFIGSNSALVAPVKIGDGAYIGSGSVITKDVEAGALAVGRARQMQKPGWVERQHAARAADGETLEHSPKKTASGG